MARDFWRNSGFHLLTRNAAGHLEVSDDFLRAYYLRPEVHPVEESCEAERALHAALMDAPRQAVEPAALEAIADADARDNYRIVLRFRDRLLDAGTLEGCYLKLFQGSGVDVPPMFVDQLAHAILRNILADCEDPLQLRAAELFYREQRVTLQDGQVLLADREMVELHASGNQYGSIGRLIVEARGTLGRVELDVLERENADLYWSRESRHDTVLRVNHGSPGAEALARVIEAWVRHFLGVGVAVRPLERIDEPRWVWHVGLDAEASAILNDLWNGVEVESGRMRRILALFRLQFDDPATMRADVAGRPVYLGLAASEEDIVHMKPQNLLLNLPRAAAA